MSFTVTRLVFRMVRRERDFSFVDKIGALTNTLILTIPHTELQRNGQYGALVIVNPVYKFESQITQTESNFVLNMEQEFDGKEFDEYFQGLIDISQRVITAIKKATGSSNDLKSIICLLEGKASSDANEKVQELLSHISKNSFVDEDSEVRQASYVWKRLFFEYFLSITREGTESKISFAVQDFQRNDMNFSNVRAVVDSCFREFRKRIMARLNG